MNDFIACPKCGNPLRADYDPVNTTHQCYGAMDKDVKRVLDTLDAVVEEFGPDYKYNGTEIYCLYVHGDKPGCLAGQVLYRLGASLEDLAVNDVQHNVVASVGFKAPIKLSDKAWAVLKVAQNAQDIGETWGTARDEAKTRALLELQKEN